MRHTNEQPSGVFKIAKRLILIVEDDPDIGPVVLQAITSEDHYQAVLVSEAAQALSLVEHLTPELFLLDYHLPGLTGMELYDRLRMQNGLEHVPTILMSADQQACELAIDRGMRYLRKPFKLAALFALMDVLLAK